MRKSQYFPIRRLAVLAVALVGLVSLGSPALAATPRQLTPSTTALTVSPTTAPAGTAINLSATVDCPTPAAPGPTGTVTFSSNISGVITTVPLPNPATGNPVTVFTSTSSLPPGVHTITAQYSGDANCDPSSDTKTVTITAATTSLTVSGSPNPAVVNQPVTLTAQVTCTGAPAGEPSGVVQFFDAGVPINGPVAVNPAVPGGGTGTATLTTTFATAGTHPITAQYTPTVGSPCAAANNNATPFNQQITAGPVTTTTTIAPASQSVAFGQPATVTATVTCPGGDLTGGTVTFTDTTTGNVLGTVPVNPATGQASLTINGLTPGTHSISAHFNGTATCAPSTTATPATVTVTTAQTISGDRFGTVTITQPTTIAPGTRIFGNVVMTGGSLDAEGAQVFGSVTVTGGTGLRLCSNSISGNLSVSGINGVTVIGDAGDDGAPACGGNTINGFATISGNTGHTEFSANTVGGTVTVNNNTNTILVPPENATTTEIESNTISGSLTCSGNVPPPSNDGKPNTATGGKFGQCAAL